jgi:hypothetical protein
MNGASDWEMGVGEEARDDSMDVRAMPDTMRMSLRDYFAGQALAGMIGNSNAEQMDKSMSGEDALARAAYVVADAMLKERARE